MLDQFKEKFKNSGLWHNGKVIAAATMISVFWVLTTSCSSDSDKIIQKVPSWVVLGDLDVQKHKNLLTDTDSKEFKSLNKESLSAFVSILELDQKFWNWFKLWAKEYDLFKRWMDNKIFDWTMNPFHENIPFMYDADNDYMKLLSDKESISKQEMTWTNPVFEVDGTGWGDIWDDYRFDSVKWFFIRLEYRLDNKSLPTTSSSLDGWFK